MASFLQFMLKNTIELKSYLFHSSNEKEPNTEISQRKNYYYSRNDDVRFRWVWIEREEDLK